MSFRHNFTFRNRPRSSCSVVINVMMKYSSSAAMVQSSRALNCVKSVQIQSFFWSVFSHIRTEYGEIRTCKFTKLVIYHSYFSKNFTASPEQRCWKMHLDPSRQTQWRRYNIVATSLSNAALKSSCSCNENVGRRYKNDVVAMSY